MPRTEARIFTSIWDDPDFLSLPPGAQRLYMFLLSQRELTYCGTMPLRPMRWARKATGLSLADIEQDLKELEGTAYPPDQPCFRPEQAPRQPFVITDSDDRRATRPLADPPGQCVEATEPAEACHGVSDEIESPRIRRALLAEVRRLPVDESPSSRSGPWSPGFHKISKRVRRHPTVTLRRTLRLTLG